MDNYDKKRTVQDLAEICSICMYGAILQKLRKDSSKKSGTSKRLVRWLACSSYNKTVVLAGWVVGAG